MEDFVNDAEENELIAAIFFLSKCSKEAFLRINEAHCFLLNARVNIGIEMHYFLRIQRIFSNNVKKRNVLILSIHL